METEQRSAGDSARFHEEFEREDLNLWSIERSGWGPTTEQAYAGDYSAGIQKGGSHAGELFDTLATATPESLDGGARIERMSYYWFELPVSFGGGIRLLSSEGDVEIVSHWVC